MQKILKQGSRERLQTGCKLMYMKGVAVSEVTMPRYVGTPDSAPVVQLHTFVHNSKFCFKVCYYLQQGQEKYKTTVHISYFNTHHFCDR